jgi:hypothetical protein
MGQSAADGLIKSVKGILNGDNAKQAIKDGIERLKSKPQPKKTYRKSSGK